MLTFNHAQWNGHLQMLCYLLLCLDINIRNDWVLELNRLRRAPYAVSQKIKDIMKGPKTSELCLLQKLDEEPLCSVERVVDKTMLVVAHLKKEEESDVPSYVND
ncbi:hypothetical protein KIN20_038462 [Parelaphostrongylus tenuis]|uniref:Uncharacterized protein n=1 Tax=Parelaphostrongylus tenuis TaxID=148309 RepID=A0AAD5RCT5_PARTN|nr:hypothetical protein KIN20_038462 [Parelaphostrongylus tenuis]